MRKFSFYFLVCLVLLSCGNDDEVTPTPTPTPDPPVPPSVSLENGSTETFFGVVGSPTQGVLSYSVKAEAPEGFVELVIFKVVDGVSEEYETIDEDHPDFIAGSNSYTYDLNYVLNANDVEKQVAFRAVVKDMLDATETLDFASAEVALPMLQATINLETALPPNGDINIKYYLLISGETVAETDHSAAVNISLDQDIAMVFSVNDGSGYYLVSPTTVLEEVIVDDIQEKSSTKFKEHSEIANGALTTDYNVYDVYTVIDQFSDLDFNAHEQKAEQVSGIGKRFSFLTDDGRVGVLQIKNFLAEGQNATVTFDLFVTQ